MPEPTEAPAPNADAAIFEMAEQAIGKRKPIDVCKELYCRQFQLGGILMNVIAYLGLQLDGTAFVSSPAAETDTPPTDGLPG